MLGSCPEFPGIITVLALAVCLTCLPAAATTTYVDGDNTSGIEDGSPEHPYSLISSAMNVATYGDTVLVMPGEYSEYIYVDMHDPMGMNRAAVVMKDGVTLRATDGPDSTLILGVSTEATIYAETCDPATRLSGFSIANEGFGYGMRVAILIRDGSPVVQGNEILPWYPIIYVYGTSSPTIDGNVVGDGSPLIGIGSINLLQGTTGTIVGNTVLGGGIHVSGDAPSVGALLVDSNQIIGTGVDDPNIGIGIGFNEPGLVSVLRNTVTNKATAIRVCCGTLHGNLLEGNGICLEVRLDCSVREEVDAEMNWWGTTDPAEIAARILDSEDDPARPSVDYSPWCIDASCITPAVERTSWGLMKQMYRQP